MTASDLKPESTKQPARPRRRWYQFSLRTACALLLVVSLLLGAFAWWRDRAERQRKVVEELREMGASVQYRYYSLWERRNFNPAKEFFPCTLLRLSLGVDFVYDVSIVNLPSPIPIESTQAAMVPIRKLRHIESLAIDGDAIRGKDLDTLPCLKSLKVLSLVSERSSAIRNYRGGMLSDDDLAPLAKATQLEGISIGYQPIGDAGLAYLRNCRNMTRVLVNGTNVGDEGIKCLSDMTELKFLDICYSRVTDEGLKALRNCDSLVEIMAAGNEMTGAGFVDLGPKPKLRSLIFYSMPLDDLALSHLKQFPNLELVLFNDTHVTGAGLPSLKHVPSLKAVAVGNCRITDENLANFQIPDGWTSITLNGGDISDAGIQGLKFPDSMVEVALSGTNVTDATLDHLARLPNLISLDVSFTSVTPSGVARFQKSCPNCELISK